MRLRLLVTCVAVLAATLLPSAVSAEPSGVQVERGRFLSLPPDLTTGYLEAHYPHRDPFHPDARHRHRKLSTATEHGVDRFNGQREVVPAGDLCAFEVTIRTWGKVPWWDWRTPQGDPLHFVANPQLVSKFSAGGRSFWTIDEGWDYFWLNDDGSEFVEGTGTHFWVHDKQRKFRMYGTWHLLRDADGELLYDKYFHDKTSVWDGTEPQIGRKICQFLRSSAS